MSSTRTMLAAQGDKIRNQQFMEAALGAAALVAMADGRVSAAELVEREQVLDRLRNLQVFDEADAIAHFDRVCASLASDRQGGTADVHRCVRQFNVDAELAQLLLRLCVVIANADLDFSDAERRVVAELCETLGTEQIDLDVLPGEETS